MPDTEKVIELIRGFKEPQPGMRDIRHAITGAISASQIPGGSPMAAYQAPIEAAKEKARQVQTAEIGREVQIFNIMDKLEKEGNAKVGALNKAAREIVGNDQKSLGTLYSKIDPNEDVTEAKLYRIAAENNLIKSEAEKVKEKKIAEEEGKLEVKKKASMPKARSTIQSMDRQAGVVLAKIDESIPQVGDWTAGFGGTLLSNLPGSAAKDLEEDIAAIISNIGFNKLDEMRQNSPTGAALGSVQVAELHMLQSVMGSLKQSQSPEQLKKALQDVRTQYVKTVDSLRDAYMQDFGSIEGFELPEVVETPPEVPQDITTSPGAVEIKERFANGEISKEEAVAKLRAIGFD